ncbi:MAG TPA: GGDEF domain-containing protein [Povalibacter sp.]|uniref:GGDEF domain-containing protein n=1 Tax=Povalibacter sp. TaxID=1962978 RepID=UPI002CFCFB5F|nr:GGDEF domain-containing protein [Povalibacter sp.]HMN44325.1 GGDEF domain-containing protein [Povalibacter sp.]
MPSAAPSQNEESLVSRVLAQGYGRLRFPEPLESEFRTDYRRNALRWIRMCVYVAVGTSIGFAIIDHWVIHAHNVIPDVVRFGLQFPVLAVALLATYQPFYTRWYERTVQVGAALFGIGTILLASYAQPDHTALVGARILLVAFFVFFMLGMRLVQALRTNVVILAALMAAGFAGLMRPEVATYLSFALVCAIIIGTAGAYALEHANRTSFLERRLLVEIAELDGLTRLLNRQTFESRVRDTWRRAVSEQRAVTVFMIDVDHFKLYNDHYGHQAGDECLRHVASAVRSAVGTRAGDFVARYGGEEIIAVVFDRTHGEADEIARRIVAEVAALGIPHESCDCTRVSVSVGAATQIPSIASSYDAIVRLADGALYTAKRQGRDRSIAVEARTAAVA